MSTFNFIYPREVSFESWDWTWPETCGIGGSETSVIEMSRRLGKRGHEVNVWAPLPEDKADDVYEVNDSTWRNVDNLTADTLQAPGIWVIYRYPQFLDNFVDIKHDEQKLWFVAQDEIYRSFRGAPGEGRGTGRMEIVDKVVCLCEAHKKQTEELFPLLRGKVVRSSNGICSDRIKPLISQNVIKRNPNKLLYASSPDRGLETLLHVFERAREYNPALELEVAYGFENIDVIIENNINGMRAKLSRRRKDLVKKMKELGVTWNGRLSQPDLWKKWLETGIWCYPTNFRETSPVHGDTIIETLDGKIPIKSLVGKEFWVYSCTSFGKLSISRAKNVSCTRKSAKVIKVTFKHGLGRLATQKTSLILTPDHEVLMKDGKYKAAGSLVVGDRVMAFRRDDTGWGQNYAAVGVTHENLIPEHRFVASWFAGRPLYKKEIVHHKDGNTRNNSPQNLEITVQSEHAKKTWEEFSPQEKESIIQKKIAGTKKFQDSLSKEELRELRGRGGSALWKKFEGNPEGRQEFIQQRCGNHVVVSIEDAGEADVYCMEVEPDHNFVANGIFVHNCIVSMEAQALGAVPITVPCWALKDNVQHGFLLPGDVKEWPICRARFIGELTRMSMSPEWQEEIREKMMPWALRWFDWDNFAVQWEDLAVDRENPVEVYQHLASMRF